MVRGEIDTTRMATKGGYQHPVTKHRGHHSDGMEAIPSSQARMSPVPNTSAPLKSIAMCLLAITVVHVRAVACLRAAEWGIL